MAGSLLQALMAHFDGVFVGPNGDYPAVLEALAGLTAVQAAWKPAPNSNSIWQIVDHLTASKVWLIDMLEKGQAAAPVWTQPKGDENDWQAALAWLKDEHAHLQAVLRQLPEEGLLTIPVPDWDQTQLELLVSLAAHEAHHSGQIDYLKGLQTEVAGK
jgi:uncharacterized damage-inducible protein DinB